MAKTNYQGVIGPIAFDEKGDLRNGPITIYVVKGGKWEAAGDGHARSTGSRRDGSGGKRTGTRQEVNASPALIPA